MPCKRCKEFAFTKDSVAEYKQTVAKQSHMIRILKGDLYEDISKLDERVRKAAFEGVNGMDPAEANQLMKDFATQMVKQQTLTEAYEYEFEGIGFAQEQAKRMSALRSEEEKRRVSALQGEIKALEVCVEEQKRKAVDDNLKLAQATRMVEKMERELCLDSPKGDARASIEKRLAIVAASLTATIEGFTSLKKRIAEDSDVVAVNGLKKELANLRTELKREKTEHAGTKSEAEKASNELLHVRAQQDQSDAKIVVLQNEIRRLKERREANGSSKA